MTMPLLHHGSSSRTTCAVKHRNARKVTGAVICHELWQGKLLPYARITPKRLRAGIPSDVRLADKCGTSYTIDGVTAAFNDIGILTWPDRHAVIVAAFLTASDAPATRMNALYKAIARGRRRSERSVMVEFSRPILLSSFTKTTLIRSGHAAR